MFSTCILVLLQGNVTVSSSSDIGSASELQAFSLSDRLRGGGLLSGSLCKGL